jgi:hypothetical protein
MWWKGGGIVSDDPYSKAAVKKILMERDGDSAEEAQDRIDSFVEELETMFEENPLGLLDAEDLVADHFGLEPDYLFDFLPF